MKKVLSILFCCCFVLMGVVLLGCSKSEPEPDPDPTFSIPYERTDYTLEFQGAKINAVDDTLKIYFELTNKTDERIYVDVELSVAIINKNSYNGGLKHNDGLSTSGYLDARAEKTLYATVNFSTDYSRYCESPLFAVLINGVEIANFYATVL